MHAGNGASEWRRAVRETFERAFAACVERCAAEQRRRRSSCADDRIAVERIDDISMAMHEAMR
ncbi:hypothetical protein WS62_31030 [Burkholderia sp. ABCPW 14]|nr:hypothetical protein WS62_31030 [Burkholderia sp. ABCPW 14]